MCPIWPMHLIIIYLLALCPLWVFCQALPDLTASFQYNTELPGEDFRIHMDDSDYVSVTVKGAGMQPGDQFSLTTINRQLATASWNSTYRITQEDADNEKFEGKMRVDGLFLGRTDVVLSGDRSGQSLNIINGTLPIVIVRPQRVIDKIFTTSVALFVSLIFINFGCAMHWPTVKDVIKRPVGPAIGLAGQFLFMPLMTFGLGYAIFPESPEMHLGMFFTGVAPGGGASNIWTFILGGNLNLSLAMTTISTIASFGLMPAWLFSLGQVVFRNANIVIPYARIAYFVAGLVIPLAIGLGMQKWTPRLSAFMVRILKGFSTTLLLFIIIFAIATNVYIFQLFTWRIIIAGMGIPWLGYAAGYVIARLFRQPHPDALAISIETGIQNTGIAIFLLSTLGQPEADLTTVIPVSVAIMTPIPMTAIFIYQKIKACINNRRDHKKMLDEDLTPSGEGPQPSIITPVDLFGKGSEGLEKGGIPITGLKGGIDNKGSDDKTDVEGGNPPAVSS